MLIQNNTPAAGYIAWSSVQVTYNSVVYDVTDGNSNKKYIWWDFTYPTVFQESDTMPTMADNDFIAFYNDSGTYHLVSIRRQVRGEMIIDGTVGPAKLVETYVETTGNETIADIKTFSSIPVGPNADPTQDNQLSRKKYVDDIAGVSDHGALSGLGDDDHSQYVLRNILSVNGDIFVLASDGAIVKFARGTDTQILSINLAKDPPFEWVSSATPGAHKDSHQNEGADEINIGGLSGELADNQPPKTHATSHKSGGGDVLKIIGQHTFTVPDTLTTGTNKTLELFAATALTITEVAISVKTAPTGASLIVDVNKNGTTIFTTQGNRPEIAISGTFDTSGAPDVTALAKNDKVTIDIDQVGSTEAGADLTVMVRFEQVVS